MSTELIADVSLVRQHELAALARMIAFIRRTAMDLNAQLPSHYLGVAMNAVIEELKVAGVDTGSIGNTDESLLQDKFH